MPEPAAPLPYRARSWPTAEDEFRASRYPRAAAHRAPREGFRSRWGRLPVLPKLALATAGLVALLWGGLGAVDLVVGPQTSKPTSAGIDPFSTSRAGPNSPTATPTADATAIAPTTEPALTRAPKRVVEKRTVTERRTIPFDTKTVRDHTLTKGTRTVRVSGVPGVRTLTYEITLTNGVQTAKRLVRSVVTKDPVDRVIAIGTKPRPR